MEGGSSALKGAEVNKTKLKPRFLKKAVESEIIVSVISSSLCVVQSISWIY